MATTLSRRNWLSWNAGALTTSLLRQIDRQEKMLTKPIPSSGERLPVIGLGSSATFAETAQSGDVADLHEVIMLLVEHGGKIFDTAPDYGASEAVAGRIASEASIANKIFWATKVNAAPQNGLANGPPGGQSFIPQNRARIDLQVHNWRCGLIWELEHPTRDALLHRRHRDLVKA